MNARCPLNLVPHSINLLVIVANAVSREHQRSTRSERVPKKHMKNQRLSGIMPPLAIIMSKFVCAVTSLQQLTPKLRIALGNKSYDEAGQWCAMNGESCNEVA